MNRIGYNVSHVNLLLPHEITGAGIITGGPIAK